jgi:hypothetical protein
MTFNTVQRSLFVLISLGVYGACRSDTLDAPKTSESAAGTPVAEAGSGGSYTADQPIRLNGDSSYDPNGDELTYSWSFSRVPLSSELADAESPFSNNDSLDSMTLFFADTAGTYIVDLVVTDSTGLVSSPDSAVILVAEGQLPLAEAGSDLTLEEGTTGTLDGSQSADPLGRTLAYTWSVVSRPEDSTILAVDSPDAMSTTFTPDTGGRYLLSLVVNNGVSDSLPDTVTVDVYSSNPLAPIADVGEDLLQEFDCTDIQLDGSGSIDPNGDELEYLWALQSKPSTSAVNNSSFSDTTVVNPTLYTDVAGDYTVSLSVFDGTDWSIPDLQTITASERLGNALPTVEAGTSIAVDAGNADCQLSGYTYNCSDCADVTVQLGVDSGVSDADGDPLSYQWYVMSGDATLDDPTDMNTEVLLSGASVDSVGACETTTYELELVAQDCPGGSAADAITLSVNCCGVEVQ